MPTLHVRVLLVAVLAGAMPALAQSSLAPIQALPFDAPESWAMAFISSSALLTGDGPPEPTHPGALTLGLEVDSLPGLTERQQTVGFGGTKKEDLNRLPVLVRPRLSLGLPGDFTATLGVVPPIQLAGVRPALYAVSLGRPLVVDAGGFALGFRVMGELGGIDGDFTCPRSAAAAGADAALNPFQCEAASTDRAELHSGSAELSAGWRLDGLGGLTPHVLVAGNLIDASFHVHARYAGIVDESVLTTRGFTVSGAAGLLMPLGEHLRASAQAFYSPLWVRRPPDFARSLDGFLNARVQVEWTFR
jgi:hypothetical protein